MRLSSSARLRATPHFSSNVSVAPGANAVCLNGVFSVSAGWLKKSPL